MKTTKTVHHIATPRERLRHSLRSSPPLGRPLADVSYLRGLGLLLVLAAIVAMAWFLGSGALEIMRMHVAQIRQLLGGP